MNHLLPYRLSVQRENSVLYVLDLVGREQRGFLAVALLDVGKGSEFCYDDGARRLRRPSAVQLVHAVPLVSAHVAQASSSHNGDQGRLEASKNQLLNFSQVFQWYRAYYVESDDVGDRDSSID